MRAVFIVPLFASRFYVAGLGRAGPGWVGLGPVFLEVERSLVERSLVEGPLRVTALPASSSNGFTSPHRVTALPGTTVMSVRTLQSHPCLTPGSPLSHPCLTPVGGVVSGSSGASRRLVWNKDHVVQNSVCGGRRADGVS